MMPTIKGIVQMRSPDGTPGSWSIVPEGDNFRLLWDNKPAPFSLFATREQAKSRMEKFYKDNPAVPV